MRCEKHIQEVCNMSMTKLLTAAVAAAALTTPPPQYTYGAVLAFDDASQPAYSNGWQAGDNGGTGFGPWTLTYSGNTNGLLYPPQFIDTAPPLPGNSLGAPAFALTTGDRNNQFETSEVRRTFVTPIAVGQTFQRRRQRFGVGSSRSGVHDRKYVRFARHEWQRAIQPVYE